MGLFPAAAAAAQSEPGERQEETQWQISKSKTAEPAILRENRPVARVTLSLPSAEMENSFDIVLVLDNSGSAIVAEGKSFAEYAADMLEELKGNGANVNVAVVGFRGYATDMTERASGGAERGLVSIQSDEGYNAVRAALQSSAPGRGSNISSGLRMARGFLEQSGTPAENQYVILLTDGKSYIWNNENEEPVTVYSQYYARSTPAISDNGMAVLSQSMEYHKYSMYAPEGALRFDGIEDLMASEHPQLTGKTPYEMGAWYSGYYEDKSGAGVTGSFMEPGTVDVFTYNAAVNPGGWTPSAPFNSRYYAYSLPEGYDPEEYVYMEANPYEVVTDGTEFAYTGEKNEKSYFWNVGSLEKATYEAAKLYEELTQTYHTGAVVNVDLGKTWSNYSHIAALVYNSANQSAADRGFDSWLCSRSEFSVGITKANEPSLPGKNASVEEFFEDIKAEILYLLASGVVVDLIGESFDLEQREGVCPVKLTVGGEELEAHESGQGDSWYFGQENEQGIYPYEVEYFTEPERLEWRINVPVENARPVTLSYEVRLTRDAIEAQEPGSEMRYPTNDLAGLDYVSSAGDAGAEEFEVPMVSYYKPDGDLPYTPPALNAEDHRAYIVGYEDGTVRPEDSISRAETAAIFFRLLKDDIRQEYMTGRNAFSDISEGDWFCTPISTLAALGIAEGYPDGSFGPNEKITRAQFAAMAARFDGYGAERRSGFRDIYGHWAESEIDRAAELGWVLGYPNGDFEPDMPIKRAEAMALINRVLARGAENGGDLLAGMITWPDNDASKWYYIDVQEATNSHDYRRRGGGGEYWTELLPPVDWTIFEK